MKNTFKYTIALAAFFAISGIVSFAQNLPTGTYQEKDGIAYRKSATHNSDGSYTVDLEAFVTGKVAYTESADPSDIVLVLDVSGSMDEYIQSYAYNKANVSSITGASLYINLLIFGFYNDSEATDYYYKEGADYYQVYKGHAEDNGQHYFFLYFEDVSNTKKYINNSGQVVEQQPTNVTNRNTNLYHPSVTLYNRTTIVTSKTKIEALKEATIAFIREVAKNAKYDKKGNLRPTELDNKIAIVKFAGNGNNNSYYNGNSDAYEQDGDGNHYFPNSSYNYTEVVRGFKSVLTDSTDLKLAINSLTASGATAANHGMKLAYNIINHIPTTRISNKTVVFFTDGAPTYESQFDNTVALEAIKNSNSIKAITYGSGESATHPSVFSVGVFSEKPQPSDNIYKFMDRLSSNFLNATTLDNGSRSSSNYYKDASGGAADLSAIFKAIAGSTASQDATIGNSSIVTVDVVSSSFSLPANSQDAELEILVAKCKGKTKIGGKEYLTFEDPITPAEAGLDPITPVFKPEDNTVSTSGFDFAANFCGPDESTTPITYRGYKQIIRFKINLKDNAVGGPAVATNDEKSGIYVDGVQFAEFNRPTVKVPVSIWIQKNGLVGDDSAVFTLYCSPFQGFNAENPESNTWTAITKIIVNEENMVEITDDNGNKVKVIKQTGLDPDYYYKIKEDSWAFGYQYQDGGTVYTVGDNIKNPFVITNKPKSTVFDEAVQRNIFNKKEAQQK